MKNRYTKWMPLGNYSFDDVDRIVFVKKNLKTGIMKFKTLRVNGLFGSCVNRILPNDLIDTKESWKEITKKD